VTLLLLALLLQAQSPVPRIEGDWWTVAASPDLGPLTRPEQEPVDFAIWQAAGGRWQIWSCIRKTGEEGRTRLLYRWEGESPLHRDWKPMGIAMRADPDFGETPGGLQAPYVFHANGEYNMFYGDWVNICRARSSDGKTFARVLQPNGRAGMFSEGPDANARDPMVLRHGARWILYYTAHPNRDGSVYARTGKTLDAWGPAKIVSKGGRSGAGPFVAECPFVWFHKPADLFYLFRTQRYGKDATTHVYASKDPLDFGIGDDSKYVTTLPVAAPEIFEYQGALYIAALRPDLKGIQIAKLLFAARP
jgi:hypothetical protein